MAEEAGQIDRSSSSDTLGHPKKKGKVEMSQRKRIQCDAARGDNKVAKDGADKGNEGKVRESFTMADVEELLDEAQRAAAKSQGSSFWVAPDGLPCIFRRIRSEL